MHFPTRKVQTQSWLERRSDKSVGFPWRPARKDPSVVAQAAFLFGPQQDSNESSAW